MRIAGVHLDHGRAVWLDAGDLRVAPLDRATALIDAREWEGEVFVAPEAVLSPPDRIDGMLVASHPVPPGDDDCGDLPGSELPVLGQGVRWGDVRATVVALDPAEHRVTIAHSDDSQTVVSLSDLSDE